LSQTTVKENLESDNKILPSLIIDAISAMANLKGLRPDFGQLSRVESKSFIEKLKSLDKQWFFSHLTLDLNIEDIFDEDSWHDVLQSILAKLNLASLQSIHATYSPGSDIHEKIVWRPYPGLKELHVNKIIPKQCNLLDSFPYLHVNLARKHHKSLEKLVFGLKYGREYTTEPSSTTLEQFVRFQ
jgi:hypothetical protein